MRDRDRPVADGALRDRRAIIRALVAATGGFLAGCSADDDASPTTTAGSTPTDTPDSSSTDTPDGSRTDTPDGSRTDTPDGSPTDTPPKTSPPSPDSRRDVTAHEGPYTAAFYYPWWGPDRHWDDGYAGTPTLGEYDSRDEQVVSQHLAWAKEYDIDSLYCSWWGPDSWEDEAIGTQLLPAAESAGVDIAILYETPGRLDGEVAFDLSAEQNRTTLAQDLASLERFFESKSYATIDGRMPVFLYLTRAFEGDIVGAIEEARAAVDHDLFLVGDQVYWQDPSSEQTQDVLEALDAVTAYNMHTSRPDIDEGFVSDTISQYEEWGAELADSSVAFVPDVIPGFDDTAVRPGAGNPIIERRPERFREFVNGVDSLRDDDLDMLFVTSFNEWHEDTQIEPGEEYGTDYLEALKAGLGSS
jgi:hypothetical protein